MGLSYATRKNNYIVLRNVLGVSTNQGTFLGTLRDIAACIHEKVKFFAYCA